MPLVTEQELIDAQVDAQTLEDVVNGSAALNGDGTVTSRLGTSLKTLAKLVQDIGAVDLGEIKEPGTQNLFVGSTAGNATVSGTNNITVGPGAGKSVTTAEGNTFMGSLAGEDATSGGGNTGIGRIALRKITTGTKNTAVGYNAMSVGTTADSNTAFGYQALEQVTTGVSNLSVGNGALRYNQSGNQNVAIGANAGAGNSLNSQSGCIFIGYNAGFSETGNNKLYIANSSTTTPLIGGDFSTGKLDFNANTINLKNNAVVNFNTNRFIHCTGSIDNLFFGQLVSNTSVTGTANTAVGYASMNLLTTGSENVAIGTDSLRNVTTGSRNTAISHDALKALTTGVNNSAFGIESMVNLTEGNNNAGLGPFAMRQLTTGSQNVGVGGYALRYNQTGGNNVAVGYLAGAGGSTHNKTGGVYLGYNAGQNEEGDNKLYIANSNTANPLIYGDFASSLLKINGQLRSTGGTGCIHGTAPTVASGEALMWAASGAGTKDGVTYAAGDVLITSNVGGTSKTALLADHSAL